jgi:hypothetical protein
MKIRDFDPSQINNPRPIEKNQSQSGGFFAE